MNERRTAFLSPPAKAARGKVRGTLPRVPAREDNPETPGPLSFGALGSRTVLRTVPKIGSEKGKRAHAKPVSICGSCRPPLVGPETLNHFGVDKTP